MWCLCCNPHQPLAHKASGLVNEHHSRMAIMQRQPKPNIAKAAAILWLCSGTSAIAEWQPEIDTTGSYLRLRPSYRWIRDNAPGNTANLQADAIGLIKASTSMYEGVKFDFQLRPTYHIDDDDAKMAKMEVDEAFLEIAVTPTTFLSAGRRNIVSGVAFGFHPTEFLEEDKKVDKTLPYSDVRALRNGVYALELQHFLDSGDSLSLIVAPRLNAIQETDLQVEAAFNLGLPDIMTDLEIEALFADKRPGAGLNLTHTVGDALVVYTETAVRRGRDRSVVTGTTMTESNSDTWLTNAVLGGSYTFTTAANLIVEYHHNANGYDDDELQAIKIGSSRGLNVTSLLKQEDLRKNYMLARLSHPSWPLLENETSLIWLRSLDDSSNLLKLYTTKDIMDSKVRLGFSVERSFGTSWSAYGINPTKWYVGADVIHYF